MKLLSLSKKTAGKSMYTKFVLVIFLIPFVALVMIHVTGRRWKTQSVVCVCKEEGLQQVSLFSVSRNC